MNERKGADPTEAVRNASYVMYAYLGGQAKREITYQSDKNESALGRISLIIQLVAHTAWEVKPKLIFRS